MDATYARAVAFENRKFEGLGAFVRTIEGVSLNEGRKFWSIFAAYYAEQGELTARRFLRDVVSRHGSCWVLASPYGRELVDDAELLLLISGTKQTTKYFDYAAGVPPAKEKIVSQRRMAIIE